MQNYFLNLFKYNEWANDRMLTSLMASEDNERAMKLFSHILNAQRMWLDRILNRPMDYKVWSVYDFDTLITLSKENSFAWIKFVELLKEGDLKKPVDYINTKGVAYQNLIEDILIQVINHSTYHRAQIAATLRESSIEPPLTDYIEYKREKV